MIGPTCQIEQIRIGELLGVAVRSPQQQDEQLLWSDASARKLYFIRNTTERHLNGGLVPQQLLRSGGNRLGILAETSKLCWMLQQNYHSVRDGSGHVKDPCMEEKYAVR